MAVILSIVWTLGAGLGASQALAQQTSAGPVDVTAEVENLDTPWAFDFLPDGGLLITERAGTLLHVAPDGTRTSVSGVPEVAARGQGGLLDITLGRDFEQSRRVFMTYAKPQGGRGAGTALASATLSADAQSLSNLKLLFEMKPGNRGGAHFGSRVVEAEDGTLFVTVGERQQPDLAQDLSEHNGTVVRVTRDGNVPADNPFVGQQGALPHIWSYGHRNPQGAALDARGRLWVNEHGARGGDEVNLIEKGANYGWPVISYGRQYSGGKIGVGTEREGMKQPAHYWDPSIAPSGMMFYEGDMFPDWQGDMFVGALKFDYISRLEVDGDDATEVEQIKLPQTARVRDIQVAPDGSIWFLAVADGTLYRMAR
ncbi:PQQ-dependent sugar dehydrogenase [Photobacterium sp. TY 1-4]|uniref:PQQ-dependent sugar dehydrogenase n=1 Tax=Pseudosulfitobacter koreensis TaxID=2968472 RepID=A0ABT1Z1Y0_9RHOB|nr:PQQ-dependent sugar dehydrogenase [Pseudosulfitobacter koreense]